MSLSDFSELPFATFGAEVWGRRQWLTRADRRPHDPHLFNEQVVDDLLSQHALRTPFLRVAKAGEVLPAKAFAGGAGLGARIADQVRDEDLVRLLDDGHTVVLQAVHRLRTPVGDLARSLADELGHPVQVNAYITPPGGQGFSAHYDTHDVFVLQCVGRKRWTLHAPVVEHPLPGDDWNQHREAVAAAAAEQPLDAFELLTGDCLYLPAGFIHAAEADAELSIHLTFGIHTVRATDVISAVFDAARQRITDDSTQRASLPIGWHRDQAAHVTTAIDDAHQALSEQDAKELAARTDDQLAVTRRTDRSRPAPLSVLKQVKQLDTVTTPRDVRLRPGIHVAVHLDDGAATLVTPTRRIPIPSEWVESLAAATAIDASGEVDALDVPSLTDDDRAAIVRLLLREGLAIAKPPASGTIAP